jgi:pimeloyl-ACP methyl ester carboxylesterase
LKGVGEKPKTEELKMADFEDCFYKSSDGLSLYYRDYPADRENQEANKNELPILCLPGLTRNSKDFAAIAEHLAPRQRVLALEFRGRGRSEYDAVSEHYVPPTYANDVIILLDHLGLDKVICLGTSLGGLVSMLLASMIPARIHAVILNDIGAAIDASGLARIASYAGQQGSVNSWAEATEQTRTTNGLAFPDRSRDWWLSFARNTFREDSDGIPVLDYDQKIGDAMRAAGGLPDSEAGWLLFGGLRKIPTLLLRGELSDILSREVTAEMQAKKSDLVVAEIAGVGHAPMLDEPDAITAIDSFLAKC